MSAQHEDLPPSGAPKPKPVTREAAKTQTAKAARVGTAKSLMLEAIEELQACDELDAAKAVETALRIVNRRATQIREGRL